MRWLLPGMALFVALLPTAASGAAWVDPPGQADTATSAVTVELDQEAIDAGPGQKISFVSTIRNLGDRPLSGLLAHVNILSSDPDVYVDPEDWSPRRTQYLDDLPAQAESQLTWKVQAVTAGPMIMYVAVTDPATNEVSVSGPLHMTVGGQRVVESGGVMPLVMGMPAAVLVLLGLVGIRRRRRK